MVWKIRGAPLLAEWNGRVGAMLDRVFVEAACRPCYQIRRNRSPQRMDRGKGKRPCRRLCLQNDASTDVRPEARLRMRGAAGEGGGHRRAQAARTRGERARGPRNEKTPAGIRFRGGSREEATPIKRFGRYIGRDRVGL